MSNPYALWTRLTSWLSPRPSPRRARLAVEPLEDRQLLSGGCWITLQNVNDRSQTQTRQYPSSDALHQELASEQNNGWLATGWVATNYDDTGCSSGGAGGTTGGSGGTLFLYNFKADRGWLLRLAARLAANPNNFTPEGWAHRAAWLRQVHAAKDSRALGRALSEFGAALRPGAMSAQWPSMQADWVAQAREAHTAHQVGALLQQLSDNMR